MLLHTRGLNPDDRACLGSVIMVIHKLHLYSLCPLPPCLYLLNPHKGRSAYHKAEQPRVRLLVVCSVPLGAGSHSCRIPHQSRRYTVSGSTWHRPSLDSRKTMVHPETLSQFAEGLLPSYER